MKSYRTLFCLSLGFSTLFGVVLSAQAETTGDDAPSALQKQSETDLPSLKNRMEERMEQIQILMSQGLVGITKEGMFSVRGNISPMQRKSISEQNTDLKAYYDTVAEMKGEKVETVQKNSAAQMIKDAGPEVWVQNDEGDWYQK